MISAGDTWFGSPPIKLPTRQRIDGIQANWTFEPSRAMRIGRAVFEAFNLSLPTMLFITFGTLAVEVFTPAMAEGRYGAFGLLFLAAGIAISVIMTLVVALVKWTLMGRYKPIMKPMWSWWAMRTEAVAVIYWGLAGKVLLDHLRGTPMLPWVLRLFGAKFGKGVFMDMTDITEFDCVNVGDFVSINALSALQTHLYEDRVMKVGRVNIGNGVTIGAGVDGALRHPCRRLRPPGAADARDEGREPARPTASGSAPPPFPMSSMRMRRPPKLRPPWPPRNGSDGWNERRFSAGWLCAADWADLRRLDRGAFGLTRAGLCR